MKLKNIALIIFTAVILFSCSNDRNKIVGTWINKDVDPPPTKLIIGINNENIIIVMHEWRLEYNENINGGIWLNTGNKGNKTYMHAKYDNKYMRVDGSYIIFSDDFTSLSWKGHKYYKTK